MIIIMIIIIIILIVIIKSYLQLIHLKKRKNYSFKTLFTIPVDLKST